MAIQQFAKEGFGQVELNNAAFRRDGRIEAQVEYVGTEPLENGSFAGVDTVTRTTNLAQSTDKLVGLVYSAEHQYEKWGLKDFAVYEGEYPRIGYLSIGDKFTTNKIKYDDGDYADETAIETAVTGAGVYAALDAGIIKLQTTAPANGIAFKASEYTTLPDGQAAIKFVVIGL
jgi:hypothetical protein